MVGRLESKEPPNQIFNDVKPNNHNSNSSNIYRNSNNNEQHLQQEQHALYDIRTGLMHNNYLITREDKKRVSVRTPSGSSRRFAFDPPMTPSGLTSNSSQSTQSTTAGIPSGNSAVPLYPERITDLEGSRRFKSERIGTSGISNSNSNNGNTAGSAYSGFSDMNYNSYNNGNTNPVTRSEIKSFSQESRRNLSSAASKDVSALSRSKGVTTTSSNMAPQQHPIQQDTYCRSSSNSTRKLEGISQTSTAGAVSNTMNHQSNQIKQINSHSNQKQQQQQQYQQPQQQMMFVRTDNSSSSRRRPSKQEDVQQQQQVPYQFIQQHFHDFQNMNSNQIESNLHFNNADLLELQQLNGGNHQESNRMLKSTKSSSVPRKKEDGAMIIHSGNDRSEMGDQNSKETETVRMGKRMTPTGMLTAVKSSSRQRQQQQPQQSKGNVFIDEDRARPLTTTSVPSAAAGFLKGSSDQNGSNGISGKKSGMNKPNIQMQVPNQIQVQQSNLEHEDYVALIQMKQQGADQQSLVDLQDVNCHEEMHFIQVEFFQKCKKWMHRLETPQFQ